MINRNASRMIMVCIHGILLMLLFGFRFCFVEFCAFPFRFWHTRSCRSKCAFFAHCNIPILFELIVLLLQFYANSSNLWGWWCWSVVGRDSELFECGPRASAACRFQDCAPYLIVLMQVAALASASAFDFHFRSRRLFCPFSNNQWSPVLRHMEKHDHTASSVLA